MQLKKSDVSKAWQRVKSDNRADEAGVLRREWDAISYASKNRLNNILTDEGFRAAASFTYRAHLDANQVFELVAEVSNPSDPEQPPPRVCAFNARSERTYARHLKPALRFFTSPLDRSCVAAHNYSQQRRDPNEFWNRVDTSDSDGCWRWIGPGGERTASGHIRICWGGKTYAHRVAYRLAKGEIELGVIRHTCDVPDCCRPEHLVDGTIMDNVRDREERNRRTPYLPRGTAHWSAKLSDRDVLELREARLLGIPATALAARYGVSPSTIRNLWAGKHYAPAAA